MPGFSKSGAESYHSLILCALVTFLFTGGVNGQALTTDHSEVIARSDNQNAVPQALLKQISDYFASLTSVTARFRQIDPKGNVSSGTLWIKMPGKARFEYDPPSSLLVVADGDRVRVQDPRLKTLDQYPQTKTPLALILSQRLNFDKNLIIKTFSETDQEFHLSLQYSKKIRDGSVILRFSKNPLKLLGWTVVMGQKATTDIRLFDLEAIAFIDPQQFVVKDPSLRP